MAHYAFIDENNVVVEVITGRDETEIVDGINDWETYYASKRDEVICKRTSFNTYIRGDGTSQHQSGGVPFRGSYAMIGGTWDADNEVFVPIGCSYDGNTKKYILPVSGEDA